jgi:hypothetical protein
MPHPTNCAQLRSCRGEADLSNRSRCREHDRDTMARCRPRLGHLAQLKRCLRSGSGALSSSGCNSRRTCCRSAMVTDPFSGFFTYSASVPSAAFTSATTAGQASASERVSSPPSPGSVARVGVALVAGALVTGAPVAGALVAGALVAGSCWLPSSGQFGSNRPALAAQQPWQRQLGAHHRPPRSGNGRSRDRSRARAAISAKAAGCACDKRSR